MGGVRRLSSAPKRSGWEARIQCDASASAAVVVYADVLDGSRWMPNDRVERAFAILGRPPVVRDKRTQNDTPGSKSTEHSLGVESDPFHRITAEPVERCSITTGWLIPPPSVATAGTEVAVRTVTSAPSPLTRPRSAHASAPRRAPGASARRTPGDISRASRANTAPRSPLPRASRRRLRRS